MSTRFVPGMPASQSTCPKCGAEPGQPCRTHRLGRIKDVIHNGRGRDTVPNSLKYYHPK